MDDGWVSFVTDWGSWDSDSSILYCFEWNCLCLRWSLLENGVHGVLLLSRITMSIVAIGLTTITAAHRARLVGSNHLSMRLLVQLRRAFETPSVILVSCREIYRLRNNPVWSLAPWLVDRLFYIARVSIGSRMLFDLSGLQRTRWLSVRSNFWIIRRPRSSIVRSDVINSTVWLLRPHLHAFKSILSSIFCSILVFMSRTLEQIKPFVFVLIFTIVLER